MAVELSRLKNRTLFSKALSVLKISHANELEDWLKVAFGLLWNEKKELFGNLYSEPNIIFYLAKFKGKPAGTSMLFLSGETAGLYMVSTLQEYRKKGIGSELTLAPLLEAKARRYKIGVLQASIMAESLYKRMGFKTFGDFDLFRCTLK